MSKRDRFRRYADKETLERITRWPSLLSRFPRVRIYSAEHCAFWRGTGQGYTGSPKESQVWAIGDAVKRTKHCCPKKKIQFIEVNETIDQLQAKLNTANEENKRLRRAINTSIPMLVNHSSSANTQGIAMLEQALKGD